MLTGKRLCPLREEPDSLRIMTYNVHSCVGLDGRVSPARIARLIAQFDPDVVALQELDVRQVRTGQVDQAHEIARDLEMDFHFHPTLHLEEGHFGNAVLSRYPMRLVKAESLPRYGLALEPRGALWVEIDVGGVPLQVVNTHLGLVAGERLAQIEMLLGAAWLGEAALRGPVVLCGDLNSSPRSPVYRRLVARLRDVQTGLVKHRPKRTFFSRYPLTRIDHVFVDRTIEVLKADVPRGELARRASDHLPVVVDLQLSKAVPAPAPLAADNQAGNTMSQNGGLRSPAAEETGEGITAEGAEERRG